MFLIRFSRIRLKPQLRRAEKFARENNCDFIVALGGGSVMDASKAIAVSATNDGDLWDYAFGKTGKRYADKKYSASYSCSDHDCRNRFGGGPVGCYNQPLKLTKKIGFGGIDELFPIIAVVDPELMKTVPPRFHISGILTLCFIVRVLYCRVLKSYKRNLCFNGNRKYWQLSAKGG